MRHVQIVVLALLVWAAPAEAKYVPVPLQDMLGSSDLIVTGRITALSEETFTLAIDERVAGEVDGAEIEVRRFRDWPCARRWAPYEEGQQVLLCLFEQTNPDGSPYWRIRSGGGEGEMPIVDGQVYYRRGNLPVDGEGRYEVYGHELFGTRIPLADLLATIRAYRALYRYVVDRSEGFPRVKGVEVVGDDAAIEAFRQRSGLAAWLVDETSGYKPFGG